MTRRPTIHDVAREAGVSKSTVSLVLQMDPAVRAETRTLVRGAMARIGYVYNRNAASLRTPKVGMIGLILNDLRNPFFAEFAASLQMALSERGYATVIGNTDEEGALQAQVAASMIGHGVSGVVISPVHGGEEATFDALEAAGIPVVQVLRKVAGAARFPFAAPDFAAGGRLAAQHLRDRGARRVAFVGGLPGRPVTEERMADPALVLPGKPTRAFGRAMAAVLARDHPDVDGVICFNDLVALGLLAGSAALGRSVGPGFAVVGFDDIEEAGQAHPGLTSVACDIAGFGRATAAALLGWLEQGVRPAAEVRTAVRLVARASTGG